MREKKRELCQAGELWSQRKETECGRRKEKRERENVVKISRKGWPAVGDRRASPPGRWHDYRAASGINRRPSRDHGRQTREGKRLNRRGPRDELG